MSRKSTRSGPSTATMLHLTGTVAAPPSHLSFPAHLALQYAQAWLLRAGGLKVPAAAVLRRALEVYVKHLDTFPQERVEFLAVKSVCEARTVPEEDQTMAELRLAAAGPEEPLPAFREVLHGKAELARRAAMNAALEARLDSLDA